MDSIKFLSDSYVTEPVGLPNPWPTRPVHVTFPDFKDTITTIQKFDHQLSCAIKYTYTSSGVWKQHAKRYIVNEHNDATDDMQIVFLTPDSEVVINKTKRSLNFKGIKLQAPVSLDDAMFARVSSDMLLIYLPGTIRLYEVSESTGFTHLDSKPMTFKISRLSAIDAATVYGWGTFGALIINIKYKQLSVLQVVTSVVYDMIILSANSFIVIEDVSGPNPKYYSDSDMSDDDSFYENLKFQLVYCSVNDGVVSSIDIEYDEDRLDLYTSCKLSATSFLMHRVDRTVCVLFYYIFDRWNTQVYKGITHVLKLYSLDIDNSFCCSKSLNGYELVVYRQIKDVETKLLSITNLKDSKKPSFGTGNISFISAPSVNNIVCITNWVDTRLGWFVVDLNSNRVFRLHSSVYKDFEDDTGSAIVRAVHVIDPYIVIVRYPDTKVPAITFYQCFEGRRHKTVDAVGATYSLDNCICCTTSSSDPSKNVIRLIDVRGIVVEKTIDVPFTIGFSNNKNAVLLYVPTKNVMRYYRLINNDLVFDGEFGMTKQIAGVVQWDHRPDGLNFFFEDIKNDVWHATLNMHNKYEYELQKDHRDLRDHMYYKISNSLTVIRRPVAVVDQYHLLSLFHGSILLSGGRFDYIGLTEICPAAHCVNDSCSNVATVHGTLCDGCQSNLPLRESMCDAMNVIPSCVPKLEEYDNQVSELDITTLPAGTLLFHGTFATCMENQDASKPRHHVFYEQGKAPKSEGMVYFCCNPWISLTEHFYFRGIAKAWDSDGTYSKLAGTNTEREIHENALRNGRPGAIVCYKLKRDIKLLNTTASNTRFKKQFCEDVGLECEGPDSNYQYNDYGMVCWALKNGFDGMLSISEHDPIQPLENNCLYFHETVQTTTKKGVKKLTDIPFRVMMDDSGNEDIYTWEIVLSDFDSYLELVTWIDACSPSSKTEPKGKRRIYTELKQELQKRPETDIWKPIGIIVEVKTLMGTGIEVFININHLCRMVYYKDDTEFRPWMEIADHDIADAIFWFIKDRVGHTVPFEINRDKAKQPKDFIPKGRSIAQLPHMPDHVSYIALESGWSVTISSNAVWGKEFGKQVANFEKYRLHIVIPSSDSDSSDSES